MFSGSWASPTENQLSGTGDPWLGWRGTQLDPLPLLAAQDSPLASLTKPQRFKQQLLSLQERASPAPRGCPASLTRAGSFPSAPQLLPVEFVTRPLAEAGTGGRFETRFLC